MKFSHPTSSESQPSPRPPRAVDVLLGIEDETDDGIEFDPKRDISKKSLEGMKGELEGYRHFRNRLDFGYTAMHLSLLFPDRKAELKLNDNDFEGMKGQLEEYRRNGNWMGFGSTAFNLSILSAERAQIVGSNIVITPKMRKLTKEPRPLPLRSTL